MTYDLENQLSFGEAMDLVKAIRDALDAMASYGSDNESMKVIGELHIVALRQYHHALDRQRREDAK